mmetsp:Transcript_32188/g.86223  ORF Transcript_32188/g.86223 Transcript_32188/m.86223 type:complete len:235 (-) Transcript_32188:672-1376(-)
MSKVCNNTDTGEVEHEEAQPHKAVQFAPTLITFSSDILLKHQRPKTSTDKTWRAPGTHETLVDTDTRCPCAHLWVQALPIVQACLPLQAKVSRRRQWYCRPSLGAHLHHRALGATVAVIRVGTDGTRITVGGFARGPVVSCFASNTLLIAFDFEVHRTRENVLRYLVLGASGVHQVVCVVNYYRLRDYFAYAFYCVELTDQSFPHQRPIAEGSVARLHVCLGDVRSEVYHGLTF